MSAANAALILDNTATYGQTQVVFRTGGTVLGGIMPDYAGNFKWLSSGNQGHQFYTSLSSSVAAASISSNGLLVGLTGNGQVSTNKMDVLGNANIGYPLGTVAPANGLIVSGNVGIGKGSPGVKLDVVGSIHQDSSTGGYSDIASYSPSGDTSISMTAGGGGFGSIDVSHTSNYNAKLPLLLNAWGGDVGIGMMTDPSYRLSVNGNVHFFGNTYTTGRYYQDLGNWAGWNYACMANGWLYNCAESTRKIKDDIRPLKEDVYKIFQAEPMSYLLRLPPAPDGSDAGVVSRVREIGYIAEDFDAIGLKDLTTYNLNGEPAGVKYDRIPLYLLEVMKNDRKTLDITDKKVMISGNVGIGTTSPAESMDVNGQIKLKKNSSQPYSCDASHDSAIALTNKYTTCVCKSDTSSWVLTADGTTDCTWN